MPALALVLGGCSDGFGSFCTSELRSTLGVEVRHAETGLPAARGVTGVSIHESGVTTELAAYDELGLLGDWQRELPGRHTILLRKPGFRADPVRTTVGGDGCHVEPRTVQAEISPDPVAVAIDAVEFTSGPEIDASPASVGEQIRGDTLELRGFAPTQCAELRAVAFRVGFELHVQIEPSDVAMDECLSPQQFQVRYVLPDEGTYLLVTNGRGFPTELFSGQVRPSQGG